MKICDNLKTFSDGVHCLQIPKNGEKSMSRGHKMYVHTSLFSSFITIKYMQVYYKKVKTYQNLDTQLKITHGTTCS